MSIYIGPQMGNVSDEKLAWAAQLGVEHVACESRAGIEQEDGTWVTHDGEFENPRDAAFHGYQGPH